MRDKKTDSLAFIDNNILDKAIYISNKSFWILQENYLVKDNKKIKYIVATKEFINKTSGKNAKQIITAKERLPDHQDATVLYALVHLAQKQKSNIVRTSYYEILKTLEWSTGKKSYEILRKSIRVWLDLEFEFINCFYTHERGHINISGKVISNITEIENPPEIIIEFSRVFLELMTKNRFFTKLKIQEHKSLKGSFQKRLYEILIKSFNNSTSFEIRWNNLKDRLEEDCKYKSEFLRKLERAVSSINRKTDLKVKYEVFQDLILFRVQNKERIYFFQMIDFLENSIEKIDLTSEDIIEIKNKCYLKPSEDNLFYLVCPDEELKNKLQLNRKFLKILQALKIKALV